MQSIISINEDVNKSISNSSNEKLQIFNKFRYSQVINEIKHLFNHIEYAFIKGDALSLLAYGKLGMRKFSDIDILVPPNTVQIIENELISKGYSYKLNSAEQRFARILCLTSSHQLMALHKRVKGVHIEVDVNYDVFWGEYTGKRIDIEEFLSDTIEMEIYGVKVKTLSTLKAMVQLILHHYKEMNSIYHLSGHDCINYNMFKDVYYLWKNNKKEITLERLYSLCHEYEIIPYAFYVLYFTNWIFKDGELQKYVDALRTAEGECYLDYYGLTEKERQPWKVDFDTRLGTDNLYELIKNDLTEEDIEKLERNRRIFG